MNMTVFSQQFYFYLVLISISSLSLMMNLVFAGPTGFGLKLIHRDSLESPLYPGRNLTQLERMERAFQQTEARQQQLRNAALMNSWVSSNNNYNTKSRSPNALRPRTSFYGNYIVIVGIGTIHEGEEFYPKIYYLVFDTASDLLWLQCKGCTNCFPQNDLFPWDTSITFNYLPCGDHLLCPTGECYDGYNPRPCRYSIQYGDGSVSTTGFLAAETLTVEADNGQLGQIQNFIFGCGMNQLNFKAMGKAVGIMGLGGGTRSIIRQLGLTKFEYCLVSWTESTSSDPSTFLRFGSDTKIGAGGQVVQTTNMFFGREPTIYYATMIDISVGGTRIRYRNELDLKSDGTGGCIFDTGTPYTSVSTAVFVPLQALLLQYLELLNRRDPPPETLYELCFEKPSWLSDFPEIIFHFKRGADFVVETSAAYFIAEDFFCFNILRNDATGLSVILGGIQQGNHRILYNVGELEISWSNEHCAANP